MLINISFYAIHPRSILFISEERCIHFSSKSENSLWRLDIEKAMKKKCKIIQLELSYNVRHRIAL